MLVLILAFASVALAWQYDIPNEKDVWRRSDRVVGVGFAIFPSYGYV